MNRQQVSLLVTILTTTAYNAKSYQSAAQVREYAQNVTQLLDGVLDGYDKDRRPWNWNNEAVEAPTLVQIDIDIRSMGPISELDMAYSMDCYFRQTWFDHRLRFEGTENDTLALGVSMLERIWKPDTYFVNGQKSYLHMLTEPNKFVRLHSNGRVHFSSRLTIKAKCPMKLSSYPLDTQNCPLLIGSFGHSIETMTFVWKNQPMHKSVEAKNLSLSQFSLVRIKVNQFNGDAKYGEHSFLQVKFIIQRRSGYYLINFYGPCSLIVILSWVSFWINREATSDRIALGATSILTMTFLGHESRSELPRVTYATALDVFLILCYLFVFGTILEFAFVHWFTKYGTADADLQHMIPYGKTWNKKASCEHKHNNGGVSWEASPRTNRFYSTDELSPFLAKKSSLHRWIQTWTDKGHKLDEDDLEINSVSIIDRVSRVLFPFAFTLANSIYWNTYLKHYHDETTE